MRLTRWHHTVASLVLIAAFWLVAAPEVSPQSRPPVQAAGSGAATRGEAWFYQRCSLCHMGRIVKDETYEPMAPSLSGLLKGAPPDREKLVREQILRGSLRMPGFRYNLTPAEFEELMAYIKTL